jgi:integrase
MIAATAWHALKSVAGLEPGEAPAGRKIAPIADDIVEATLPFCNDEVRVLVELQRLSGARSGELVIMRTAVIDSTGPVWTYKPTRHKTESRGHERVIYFGRRAQSILKPWLRPALHGFIFSPARCPERRYAALRAKRKSPVPPSQLNRRKVQPEKLPGDRWTVAAYANAIEWAVKKANAAISQRNAETGEKTPLLPHWHPHRLRHSAASAIRREFGLEVAKAVLGHATLQAAQIYAEADSTRAREVALAIG